jgi:hypothetical protein
LGSAKSGLGVARTLNAPISSHTYTLISTTPGR